MKGQHALKFRAWVEWDIKQSSLIGTLTKPSVLFSQTMVLTFLFINGYSLPDNKSHKLTVLLVTPLIKTKTVRFARERPLFWEKATPQISTVHNLKKIGHCQFTFFILLFLFMITTARFVGQFHQKLLMGYFCLSLITFLVYGIDKSKVLRGRWRLKRAKSDLKPT